jgi:hypothetical protein
MVECILDKGRGYDEEAGPACVQRGSAHACRNVALYMSLTQSSVATEFLEKGEQ